MVVVVVMVGGGDVYFFWWGGGDETNAVQIIICVYIVRPCIYPARPQ